VHGLVSLLPEPYYQRVEEIWRELKQDCGLTGIQVTPYPHFSWQLSEEYDIERTKSILQSIAKNTAPFSVFTSGIALFTQKIPTIYIPVIRTMEMNRFHSEIWQKIRVVGTDVVDYYRSPRWVPHISLAYADVDSTKMHCALEKLAFADLTWNFYIDNVALIYEPEGQVGELKYKIPFRG